MGSIKSSLCTMPKKEVWKSLVAEFVCTFIVLFVGCGSVLYTKDQEKPDIVSVALCWGFTIATVIQISSHVSGCHLNPAATIAFLVTGKIDLVKSILYIIVQCLGAIAGVAMLQGFTPHKVKGDFATLSVSSELTAFQGVAIEFVITFILLFLSFAVSDENRTDVHGSPALAIGLTVSILIMGADHHTGAGLNPARVLGPAVIVGNWKRHWVYWVGDIAGGVVGALVYEHIFSVPKPKDLGDGFHGGNTKSLNASRVQEMVPMDSKIYEEDDTTL